MVEAIVEVKQAPHVVAVSVCLFHWILEIGISDKGAIPCSYGRVAWPGRCALSRNGSLSADGRTTDTFAWRRSVCICSLDFAIRTNMHRSHTYHLPLSWHMLPQAFDLKKKFLKETLFRAVGTNQGGQVTPFPWGPIKRWQTSRFSHYVKEKFDEAMKTAMSNNKEGLQKVRPSCMTHVKVAWKFDNGYDYRPSAPSSSKGGNHYYSLNDT